MGCSGKMDHLRMFYYKLELQHNFAWIKFIVEIILSTLFNLTYCTKHCIYFEYEVEEFAFFLLNLFTICKRKQTLFGIKAKKINISIVVWVFITVFKIAPHQPHSLV